MMNIFGRPCIIIIIIRCGRLARKSHASRGLKQFRAFSLSSVVRRLTDTAPENSLHLIQNKLNFLPIIFTASMWIEGKSCDGQQLVYG